MGLSDQREADTLNANFEKQNRATDNELTDDHITIGCENDFVIGLTIPRACRRGDQ